MTYEQSIDLAELQADMAFEAYLTAFDEDAHPETLDSLETEALIARSCYDDLRSQGLGHWPRHPCGSSDPQGFDAVSQKLRYSLKGCDSRHFARDIFVFLAPDPRPARTLDMSAFTRCADTASRSFSPADFHHRWSLRMFHAALRRGFAHVQFPQ
ncbi:MULTISPECIES: hypothetical protein [unclassified Roseovarius]|uniref:hypothetical protein n=1 Tax=unclassified Roseovarius TaxID=2614913 RepID=UPI00125F6EBD|nr:MULTISPECIES: hypothetical protein [unclassified Roseovarius]